MTRKLKGKAQYVAVEPNEGTEIRKMLGHIISNPYSPTDYCISTDEHPYLQELQKEVTGLVQNEIKSQWAGINAVKVLQQSINADEFQRSLHDKLIECLRSDNAAFRSIITIRRIEDIINTVLHTYLRSIVRRLLDEIIAMKQDARQRFGARLGLAELPNDEARREVTSSFKSVLQDVHTKLLKLEGTICRELLRHTQGSPRNANMSDFDEVIPMPNRAIRAVLEESPPSTLDTAVFSGAVKHRLRNVARDFKAMLPDYIFATGAIIANRPTDEKRHLVPAIQQFNDELQGCLAQAISNQHLGNNVFVHDVRNQMNDVQLHEMQQCAHGARRPRLSDAVGDLRRKIRVKITEADPAGDADQIDKLMNKITEKRLEDLTIEKQRKVCIATQLLKAENCLTADQAEFLERDNTERKTVIIRRVGQYPDIFETLQSQNDYGQKLNSLLYERGAAYLVTSTYSYLEDARDEVLFGIVIHKVTLGPIKGAYYQALRWIRHGFSCEPQLDKAQISHEPNSVRFTARAF